MKSEPRIYCDVPSSEVERLVPKPLDWECSVRVSFLRGDEQRVEDNAFHP